MVTRHLWEPHLRRQPIELPHSCPKNPTVSVITLAYNHAEFINECIDGILMQEKCNYEAIIIEDESSDQTREICIARQRERPDRLRVILNHRENNIQVRGAPTGIFSILYAIAQCRGQYIAFCEGDDIWIHHEKIHLQSALLLSQPQYSYVCHDTLVRTLDGSLKNTRRDYGDRTKLETSDVARLGPVFHTSSVMMQAEAIRNLPIQMTRWKSTDKPLFMHASLDGPIARLPLFMSIYRHHHGGVTRTASHKDRLTTLVDYWEMSRVFERDPRGAGNPSFSALRNSIAKSALTNLSARDLSRFLRAVGPLSFMTAIQDVLRRKIARTLLQNKRKTDQTQT